LDFHSALWVQVLPQPQKVQPKEKHSKEKKNKQTMAFGEFFKTLTKRRNVRRRKEKDLALNKQSNNRTRPAGQPSANATPQEKTSAETTNGFLLDRLGRPEVLTKVIDDFIVRVAADTTLVGFFAGVDLTVLKLHQKRFFSMAFTTIPTGISVENNIRNHHQRLFDLGLNENHFDMIVVHLIAALKACEVDEDVIHKAGKIVLPLRSIFEEGATDAHTKV
jgi:hemoglobin